MVVRHIFAWKLSNSTNSPGVFAPARLNLWKWKKKQKVIKHANVQTDTLIGEIGTGMTQAII